MTAPRPDGPPPLQAPLALPPRVQKLRAVCVALSGFAAALSGGEPTGLVTWDVILKFAFGAIVALVGSRADRRAILALAIIPLLFAWRSPWLVGGLIALVIYSQTLADSKWRHRYNGMDAVYSAAAAGFAIQTALRMHANAFFGFTAGITALLFAALVATAWQRATPAGRSLSVKALGALGVLLFVALIGAVVALPAGRGATSDGVYAVEQGFDAANAGDFSEAERYLANATTSFQAAEDNFSSILARPARLVPILSQHLDALDEAVVSGASLSDVGAKAASELNGLGFLREDGSIDTSKFLAAKPLLDESLVTLAETNDVIGSIDNPWLIGSLTSRLESLTGEVAEATDAATLAMTGTDAVPKVLGSETPQQFLVLYGSPTRARELGGAMEHWSLVETSDGTITQLQSGTAEDLQALRDPNAILDTAADYPSFYILADPASQLANITSLPSMTHVAQATSDLFPTLLGHELDGVIYVDPEGLAGLLQLVGEVSPEPGLTLDTNTVAQFLLRSQYQDFPDAADRQRIFDTMTTEIIARLGTLPLDGLEELTAIAGPAGSGKHFQIATFDPEVNDFLGDIGLLQDFRREDEQDFLSVSSTNQADNRLDAWIERTILYDAEIDAVTGALEASVTVRLSSTAPGALPGEHRSEVAVWTPHQLTETRLNGFSGGLKL